MIFVKIIAYMLEKDYELLDVHTAPTYVDFKNIFAVDLFMDSANIGESGISRVISLVQISHGTGKYG